MLLSCSKDEMIVVEVVHYSFEMILEMEYFEGENIICYFLLQPSIVGIIVFLKVFMMCLMICYECWLS